MAIAIAPPVATDVPYSYLLVGVEYRLPSVKLPNIEVVSASLLPDANKSTSPDVRLDFGDIVAKLCVVDVVVELYVGPVSIGLVVSTPEYSDILANRTPLGAVSVTVGADASVSLPNIWRHILPALSGVHVPV